MTGSNLKIELEKLIGKNKVSSDIGDRLCFSRDVTPICYKWIDLYKLPPYICDVVVSPENTEDVIKIVQFAKKNKIKIFIYGGGSGVVGGVIPTEGGITIDMSRMSKVVILDEESLTIEVESGIIGQNLEDFLNKKNYTLRHFPQSIRSASVGGFIATKSTGQFSTKYGGIENYVTGLEVVLPDGNVLITSDKPRSSTGPDINNFFIGSEGIFGIITRAILKIYKMPEKVIYHCFIYEDIFSALDSIREIMQTGLKPPVIRLYNREESRQKFAKLGFDYDGCLMILCFEGNSELVDAESEVAQKICTKMKAKNIGDELGKLWFDNRFDTRHILEKEEEFGGVSDAIELAASWSKIKKLYADVESYFRKKQITLASHFSHAYTTGISVYNIFFLNVKDEEEAIKRFYAVWNDVMEIALNNDATISHHHGIGIIKKDKLREELNEGINILENLKEKLDPDNIINPDKLITKMI
ncbi:FAD-binding oxidoreductase [bacterium]|nr:FAD-binding oxidoreductase [bacterium]